MTGSPAPASLRVLFLNSVKASSFGGGERWMVTIARALQDRGHGVLVAGRKGSLFLGRAAEEGLHTREVQIRGEADPGTLAGLRRLYASARIDVVVANFNKDVRLAGVARLPGRRPRVLARNGLAILPNNARYRLTYRRLADGIVTNTESIRSFYLGFGWIPPDFVHVVHNGITPPPADPRSSEEVRASLSLPTGGRWIGAFGRMVTQKRFDLFLQAVARLSEEIPDLQALLVGDGPEKEALADEADRLEISDRVHTPGFQKSVWDWYRACDVVALTSASEGLPNAVLEAMALGRATVAFNVGGVREMIADDTQGRVVPAGDVDALVREARAILGDTALRKRLGTGAADRVRNAFSIEAMTDRMETILDRLVADGRGPGSSAQPPASA
jgi:glycosyltransferase involved in cell wall biosynthesis